MRIDGPQITGSFSLNGDGVQDLDSLVTTSSLNTYTSSMETTMGHVHTATHSLNTFTSSTNTRLNSIEGVTGSYATTGSNIFVGNQSITGSLTVSGSSTFTNIGPAIFSGSVTVPDITIDRAYGSNNNGDPIIIIRNTNAGNGITFNPNESDNFIEMSTGGTITAKGLTVSGSVTAPDIIVERTYGSNNNGDPIIIIKNSSLGNGITFNPNESGNIIQMNTDGTISAKGLTVTGHIEAQELRTTYISSSILYRSGSTKFGDELTDTHAFTGSVLISGSLNVPGSGLISGSLQVLNGSGVWSGSAQLPSGVVSGSAQVLNGTTIHSGSFFNGISVVSGSAQIDVLSTTNIARLATTGSNTFTSNQVVTGSLSVSGSNTFNTQQNFIVSSSGQGWVMALNNQSNNTTYIGIDTYGPYIQPSAKGVAIYNGSATKYLYVTSSGVGVNKLTPNADLDVNGNGLVSGSLTTTGRLSVSGSTLLGEVQSSYALLETTTGNGIWLRPAGGADPTGLKIATNGAATFSNTITSLVNGSTFGTASSTGRAVIIQGGSANQAIQFKNAAGGDATLYVEGTSTAAHYRFDTYSTSNAFFIANGGNIGVATNNPGRKFTVIGTTYTEGFINTDQSIEKILSMTFSNGTSNQAVDLVIGNIGFAGYFEVQITSTYSYQQSMGVITKIFGVGTNPNGSIYTNESRVTECIGDTPTNFAIGNFQWDSSNSYFKIPISHLNSNGNPLIIRVKSLSQSSSATLLDNITLSSVYTLSALSRNYEYFNNNLGIGTSTPDRLLTLNGDFSIRGNNYISTNKFFQWEGGAYWTTRTTSSGNQFEIYRGDTATTVFEITSGNYVHLGKGWGASNHRINLEVAQGNNILVVSAYAGASNDSVLIKAASGANPNAAGTVMEVTTNSSTGRSISAGGTINTTGNDYAEYMLKAVTDNISKGDIVGIDNEGLLTNIFSDAVSFVVKSTNPSYVGGDAWGNIVGKRPERTADQTEEEFALILAEFEAKLEVEREKVDRIAFSGQVPVNVTGATVGDYIIPMSTEDGKITGQPITNPTFEQYQISVGKVWKIMEDGRAFIAVKIG